LEIASQCTFQELVRFNSIFNLVIYCYKK